MIRLIGEIAREHKFLGIEGDLQAEPGSAGCVPPDWVHDGPVYAVFVRNFSETGTLKEVTVKIPELKALGIGTVWLMPICPIGRQNRKGQYGSPYAIADHTAIAPDLGSAADLSDLVRAVHKHGMHIILDFVGNHAARDHRRRKLLQSHNTRSLEDWTDIADFDFSRPDTHRYLAEAFRYWIETFDFDGYRCDVAGLMPDAFWRAATEPLYTLKPDLFLLAEWQRPLLQARFFHAGYDWVHYLILKDIRNKARLPGDIIRWEREWREIYPEQALLLRFTENHDLPRTTDTFGSGAFPVFAGLLYCLSGIPLIYAGQEWGLAHRPELFEKDPVLWDQGNSDVYAYYRSLIKLRREHPVLASGEIEPVISEDRESVVFRKHSPEEDLIIAANFGQERSVGLPPEFEGEYTDLLSGETFAAGRLDLAPYRLYILQRNQGGN